MKIDQASLARIAHLARLNIVPSEEASLLKSMDSVLTWMEQLNEIDTEGVEPLTHILDEENKWREDISTNLLSREEALGNAPARTTSYFKVPKVIE
ncbi:Asp-tRNA(Asn)/Glu-tRNA(Gln) amidotransferase subunit GatC [Dyadobacter sandarakinus]|uniref:Aspartyl/glutamyl-tRNA(Asn/Gln) amidotransferase subunit C n=1 Tax=Dyadobacter sandarakinus TaxID=2747268 RepID=A0ABX7IAP9_9BACT|nr:Asp-tRNA(Asn)/Glu-tRNA(Gln) amidotransferase subunit GatC [Dyadobacter sandarakinus]QRR02602.1 Asp-tRNA(Asn)/Glu-tRNA(Gln) amidotransferase subunit GatC [Dyadobacter sandarakinus]